MIISFADLPFAINALNQDLTVAFPTETVYGLGANAYCSSAIEKIFAIKNRPAFNPLIVHYPTLNAVLNDGLIPQELQPFLQQFWPGPLTVVVKRRADSKVSPLVTARLDTLAVRIPAHPLALTLLNQLEFPLAAPSANTSGGLSPTNAEHVYNDLKEAAGFIIDGGACTVGIESTIIDITQDPIKILRPGYFLPSAFNKAVEFMGKSSTITCPGQLNHHYAPRKSLRINAFTAGKDEGFILFGPAPRHQAAMVLQLSAAKNCEEAATLLFQHLHTLDQSAVQRIAVMPIPMEGIGIALNDRLQRAATPKGEQQ